MGKQITVADCHTTSTKIDHRNGQESEVQNPYELRPVMDGYKNITVPDKAKFKREFVTLFVEDLEDLLVRGDLKFDDWKVLLWLVANLEKNNMIISTLDIISNGLGIDRMRVSRSLNRLKRRNVVVEMKLSQSKGSGPRASVWQVQIVNPYLCYNGQTMQYHTEIVKYPRLTKEDGETLLNQKAEQKRIAEKAKNDLFPETYPHHQADALPADPLAQPIECGPDGPQFVGNNQTGEFDIVE